MRGAKPGKENPMYKHGGEGTKLYIVWAGMKNRCYNPHSGDFPNYGGRGITVCEEWKHDFRAFREWAYSNGYKETLTIDRIDVNGNYAPTNCRWATMKEQSRNVRRNINIEYQGEVHCISEWAEITGLKKDTIRYRYLAGLSAAEILQKGDRRKWIQKRKCARSAQTR